MRCLSFATLVRTSRVDDRCLNIKIYNFSAESSLPPSVGIMAPLT